MIQVKVLERGFEYDGETHRSLSSVARAITGAHWNGMAFFGLFQAIFMANGGGAWDNAKKIVEVELKMKNTPLHAATVVGDTVGDPFKDTSSVSLNPVIKFTTLFGLLAVEIAVKMPAGLKHSLGAVIFVVGLVFVYRSFYGMRIPVDDQKA